VPVSFRLFSQAPSTTVRVITINDRQVKNVGIIYNVARKHFSSCSVPYTIGFSPLTLSYEITLPSSPEHLLERPSTFHIEYNNASSDIQIRKCNLTCMTGIQTAVTIHSLHQALGSYQSLLLLLLLLLGQIPQQVQRFQSHTTAQNKRDKCIT
jgi:hypothetical protein